MRTVRFTAIAILTCAVAAAGAAEPERLAGTYTLSPEAGPLLRLYLTGGAASDLYRTLSGAPRKDQCFADGSLTKTEGDVVCTRHPRGIHECWIGIDLKSQRVVPGFAC